MILCEKKLEVGFMGGCTVCKLLSVMGGKSKCVSFSP